MLMKAIGILCLGVFGTLLIGAVLAATLVNAGYVAYDSSGSLDEESDKSLPIEDETNDSDFTLDLSAANSVLSAKDVELSILTPLPESVIECPFSVVGIVPANWAFEGQLPISLINSAGVIVDKAPAMIRGDWTSGDMGLLTAALTCPDGGCTGNATIVLSMENPSGIPENGDSAQIPFVFGESCN